MKQLAVLLLMGSCLSFSLFADEIVEIDKEDLIVIPESPKKQVKSSSDPKVVILNNQQVDQDQKSAQDHNQTARIFNHQPAVRVMGTPITTTYAVELKKSRQNAELQTEQKIVEKLESSRLRDEQERLKKLFGRVSIQKTVVSSDQAMVLNDSHATDKSEIYTKVVSPVQKTSVDNVYMGVYGGQGLNLTRALEGINSYGSIGVALGATDESGLKMESSFFYTNHQLTYTEGDLYSNYSDESVLEDMDQFSAFLSVKYTPFSSRFQPYIGVALSYSHRIYSGNITYSCDDFRSDKYCEEGAKTNSVDLAANVGVDFRLNKKVSIGFSMLVNVKNIYNTRLRNEQAYDYDYDYDYDNDYAIPVKPEETSWIIASINAKLYF